MLRKLLFVVALLSFASLANAGGLGCDVGLYSKYVNGIGGVAGKDREPVMQGDCRHDFANGAYVDGWFSQSTKNPGFRETFANEVDLTIGVDKKINAKWSADLHAAYFDLANPKLLQGPNGDILNGGTTLRYQATAGTKVYGNLEGYRGIGSLGVPGGWRAGLGAKTTFGPVVVDGTLFHNHNFLGHGEFLKVMLEPVKPIAKFAGGEIRPTLFIYRPLGEYRNTRDNHVVAALHITF